MCGLRMAGVGKVKAGLTTMAEVLRVTPGDSVTNALITPC
jgi:general secretion pathway protein E